MKNNLTVNSLKTARIITAMLLGLSLMSPPVQAQERDQNDKSCLVTFAFLMGGQPAMKPVSSTITRNGAVISTQQQHIFNKQLECGRGYTIKGSFDNATYSRDFTVLPNGNTISINMGH